MERRLAAILAVAVVGFSRLMECDEAGTLAMLKSRRAEIVQPMASKRHDCIIKVMGDGALVEFASVVNRQVVSWSEGCLRIFCRQYASPRCRDRSSQPIACCRIDAVNLKADFAMRRSLGVPSSPESRPTHIPAVI